MAAHIQVTLTNGTSFPLNFGQGKIVLRRQKTLNLFANKLDITTELGTTTYNPEDIQTIEWVSA